MKPSRNRPLKPFEKASFDGLNNEPYFWVASASRLIDGVKCLRSGWRFDDTLHNDADGWRHCDLEPFGQLRPVSLMLSAMALECLLKGLCVAYGDKLARDGKMITPDPDLKGHPLGALLTKAEQKASSLSITGEDRMLATQLEPWIELGRYTTRSNADKDNPGSFKQCPKGRLLCTQGSAYPRCEIVFDQLANKLVAAIQARAQQGE